VSTHEGLREATTITYPNHIHSYTPHTVALLAHIIQKAYEWEHSSQVSEAVDGLPNRELLPEIQLAAAACLRAMISVRVGDATLNTFNRMTKLALQNQVSYSTCFQYLPFYNFLFYFFYVNLFLLKLYVCFFNTPGELVHAFIR
jgi:hypothetical protein